MDAVGGVVTQLTFEESRTALEELTTTEGRLLVSSAILFLTLLVAVLVAPYIIRYLGRQFRNRFSDGRAVDAIDIVSEYIPTTISGLVLRLFQLVLIAGAVFALLLVWGLVDGVVSLLSTLGITFSLLTQSIVTALVLLFAYIGTDILENSVKDLSDGADRVTDHQQEIIIRLGTVGIFAFALTAVLTLWGLNLSGLLVGAGFLGIVVGMAARQTLGSMIAGFVLMFSRPFTIGDWVEIEDYEGIVTDITIMNTRMRNFDGESIVMPNDKVSNSAVTNRSEQGHLRLRVEVGIDYETDPDYAETVALEELREIESITDSPPPVVVPTGFGDSAVLLEMRFWIDRPTPPRQWRATRQVIHRVKERFDDEDIAIPFPQRTVSGRRDTDEFRIPDTEPSQTQQVEPSPED